MSISKPTHRDLFARAFAIVSDSTAPDKSEVADFLAGRIVALDKRKVAKRAPKPETLAARLDALDVLTDAERAMTATEVATAIDVSVQRATAALTALVKAGSVTRLVDGKDVTFTV